MARRIIIGLLLTLLLLAVARRTSKGRSSDVEVERDDFGIHHRTVAEQIGPGEPLVRVDLSDARGSEVWVSYAAAGDSAFADLQLALADDGAYEGRLPDLGKGARLRYAIRVITPSLDLVRLPERPDRFYTVKYKGPVSPVVLVLHIACMFGAFFFMIQSFWSSVALLRGAGGKGGAVANARWALLLSFLGGWPLGFALNYQTFGVLWEGYPFGFDVTDNKTQLMFILWLASLLLVRGSLLNRGEDRDTIGARAFAWAIVASFIASLALFLVPHSL